MVDPATGEVKTRKELPYPNLAGALTTGGGIVVTALLDGTIVALDDQTLEELWSVNVGTGFMARHASLLMIPITISDQPIGVLEFTHRTHRRWTTHDIANGRGLAAHLAQALRRISM